MTYTSHHNSVRVSLCGVHVSFAKVRSEEYLVGQLDEAVRVDESLWTLAVSPATSTCVKHQGQSQVVIVITLDKCQRTWWRCVVRGHAEIDTSRVDSTQRVTDYDDETQAALRKIMFEQQQKVIIVSTCNRCIIIM